MNILFVEGGTKYKVSSEGKIYSDLNFDKNICDRYSSFGENLTIIGKKDEKIYQVEELGKKYNEMPKKINCVLFQDIYSNKKKYLSLKLRKLIKKGIEEQIAKSDFVIIRSITNFYTITAIKICEKLKKKYLVEVTGIAFETLWYHGGIEGKILSFPIEIINKIHINKAPNVLYVTDKALQERYPTMGNKCGCSDVEIESPDKSIIEIRQKEIEKAQQNKILNIGTIGKLDMRIKGQFDVIKALKILKENGIKFNYRLLGSGSNEYLLQLAKKYNVEDCVIFDGSKPHAEVSKWLDNIDIYIQPSYTEGLCRSIIEAMSRGCLIVASDVGGNNELTKKEYLFKKGNASEIADILKNISIENLKEESKYSFENSMKYQKELLDKKRNNFYNSAINGGN